MYHTYSFLKIKMSFKTYIKMSVSSTYIFNFCVKFGSFSRRKTDKCKLAFFSVIK